MRCREITSALRAVLATAALVLASALPAAGFTVALRGATTEISQDATGVLTVVRTSAGDLEVDDGGPVSTYPPATNLVIRGSTELTPTFLVVLLDSALPGSLTLDLPGASSVTLRGAAPSIGGSLAVKGSDSDQVVSLGGLGSSVAIGGGAKIDLRGGNDEVRFVDPVSIVGSLKLAGVNVFWTTPFSSVGGSFSVDVKRDSLGLVLDAQTLHVGKSVLVTGGPASDRAVLSGTIGGNATFKMGGGVAPGEQRVDVNGRVAGNLKIAGGKGAAHRVDVTGDVGGSVQVTLPSDANAFDFRAEAGGPIRYIGGPGTDAVDIYSPSPNSKATFRLGAGADSVYVSEKSELKLLSIDFGADTDSLFDEGAVLAASKYKNLP